MGNFDKNMRFSTNIVPSLNSTGSLGGASQRWDALYANNILIGANQKVRLWEDGEGGKIALVSKDGTYRYEFDAFSNNYLRIFASTDNGISAKNTLSFNGDTGRFSASGPVRGSALEVNGMGDSDFVPYIRTWSAQTQGQTWSRVLRLTATTGTVDGLSGILFCKCTRNSVVCNATFMLNISHSRLSSRIVVLGKNGYSSFQIRLVTNDSSDCYVEIYDTAASIAATTKQVWTVSYFPLTNNQLIEKIYTFTNGTTLPSTSYNVPNSITV